MRLVQAQTCDLFLLGEHLPDAECAEILEALRQSGKTVPCIVMQTRGVQGAQNGSLRLQGVREVIGKREYSNIVRLVTKWIAGSATSVMAEAA
ncbi:MAG: hypothetical protein LAN64_20430 [Acidobacteriia bacterium]|nr:hypothetical protein [Terriglobia bacterium]